MPEILTAQALYEQALSRFARNVAVVDGERVLTYADLDARSARLANALLAFGAGPHRPATTLLPNRCEFIELDAACTRAGITRIGINERLSADECIFILEHSQSAVLLTTPENRERLGDVPKMVKRVILVGDDYENLLADASTRLRVAPVSPDAPNYILYTSGTTGRPKGATHSHGSRLAATRNMMSSELELDESSAMMHTGPLTHGSGSKIIALVAAGGRNVVIPRFDEELLADAAAEGGTHTFLVPTMVQRLVAGGEAIASRLRNMKQISFGGSPISPRTFAGAIEAFGPILTQVYGSSEAPHPVTILQPADYESNADVLMSAGRAASGVDVRIVDGDGISVEPGDVGELIIASPHVMSGYWRDPDATAAAFSSDGAYLSGDLASVDERGFHTFRDRKRDLIISGGMNVYPTEVERVLLEHPEVRQAAVVGYPDDEWGESILAFVVPREQGWNDTDSLVEWTRSRLASYKKPRQITFVSDLPMGSSGKILKRALRDPLWENSDRLVN